jgi:hypothetical protein
MGTFAGSDRSPSGCFRGEGAETHLIKAPSCFAHHTGQGDSQRRAPTQSI